MGRAHEVRAASMAKTAAMKSKLYARYGKEIYVAAKGTNGNPDDNPSLRAVLEKARSNNMPKDNIQKAIDKAVFPGTQGGPLEHVIAAKAVSFGEALKPEFTAYQKQIVANAKALAEMNDIIKKYM